MSRPPSSAPVPPLRGWRSGLVLATALSACGCADETESVAMPTAYEICIQQPQVEPVEAFPYTFVQDDPVHVDEHYESLLFRAEGRSLAENAGHLVSYAEKNSLLRRQASSAEAAYFERQRELAAAVIRRGHPTGADRPVVLGLVGDLMWVDQHWEPFLDDELLARMRQADGWLGNLETPIIPSAGTPSGVSLFPVYQASPSLIREFRREARANLFRAFSFANNHTLDQGDEGVAETLDQLALEGIATSGAMPAGSRRFVSFELGGIRFGFYAATWGLNEPEDLESTELDINTVSGLAPLCEQEVRLTEIRDVLAEMATADVEFRVVMLHWGYEYELYPDPLQVAVAREIARAGADLVVGAHSHVPQPSEICFINGYERRYAADHGELPALQPGQGCVLDDGTGRPRKTLVMYSLGNFLSSVGNFLCELGIMHELPVFRAAVGTVDWAMPTHAFVYNLRAGQSENNRHRLMPMQRWLEQACPGERCDLHQSELRFLRGHLGSDRGLER